MEAIQVVLAPEHPIRGAGAHILEEVRYLFEDLAPDMLMIDMTLAAEHDLPLPDVPTPTTPARVLLLKGHRSRIHVFALLSGETDVALTEQAALQAIAAAFESRPEAGAGHHDSGTGSQAHHCEGAGTTTALTSRERDVLRELTTGKCDQDIGQQLGISVWTVRYHLKHIYRKLMVRRRSEAIAWVIEKRWDG